MKQKYWPVICILILLFFVPCGPSLHAGEKEIRNLIHTDYSVSDPAFQQSISALLESPLVEGNKIETLLNGDRFFSSMLEAIRGAKKTITLETFIWRPGDVSDEFVDAFCERARAGVKVHLMVDGFGGRNMKRADIAKMEKAGVRVEKYGHKYWWNVFFWLNHRTHRKILVVDGKIGYTGGACISDEWSGNAEGPPFWRDTQFRIEGPAVAELQSVFMDNWIRMRNRVLHGEDYFPAQPKVGNVLAQCFKSGPRDGEEKARMNYLMAIAAARKSIRIANAYFVPDKLALKALLEAAARGVKIEVIMPGETDSKVGKAAMRWHLDKMLIGGLEIYEYRKTLFHCKIMIVDDIWVTAGSVNFDNRSFYINSENSLNVLDKNFAAEQIKNFEEDRRNSERVVLEKYRKRSVVKRAVEYISTLFRSQL